MKVTVDNLVLKESREIRASVHEKKYNEYGKKYHTHRERNTNITRVPLLRIH